jgi:predicted ester cyclase
MFRWQRVRPLTIALVAVLLGGALAGPAGTVTAQSTACPTATDAEAEQLALAWTEMFNTHDVSIVDEIASGNVHHSGVDGEHSAETVKETQLAIFEAYPDMAVTVNLTLASAPYAVVQWTATGTNTGELRGAAPTGETATWDGIFMARVDCSQIVESWAFIDQLAFTQDTGPHSGAAEPEGSLTEMGAASPAACPTATEEEMADLAAAWWSEGWAGDLDVLDQITADDIYHHWATGPDSIGADAQSERIAALTTGFDGTVYTWDEIVVDGEYVAAVWEATGTLSSAVLGLEPSENTVTWSGANIFRIECGQIAEVWSEMDTFGLRAQLAGNGAEATPAP